MGRRDPESRYARLCLVWWRAGLERLRALVTARRGPKLKAAACCANIVKMAIRCWPLNWVCSALLRDVIEPRTGCIASRHFIALSTHAPCFSRVWPVLCNHTHTHTHILCLSQAHYCSTHAERSALHPLSGAHKERRAPGLLFACVRPVWFAHHPAIPHSKVSGTKSVLN